MMDKVWYSLSDLCERFGKSRDAMERLLRKGTILGKKVGRDWRVHRDALAAYEADGIPQPAQEWAKFRSAPARPPRASPRVAPGCAA
jgi:excisionase family DNA binding protein